MKPKLPVLITAALISALTAIACTKTDSMTAAEAPSHGAGTSVEASGGASGAKSESDSKRKAKRPLHERARVWLT